MTPWDGDDVFNVFRDLFHGAERERLFAELRAIETSGKDLVKWHDGQFGPPAYSFNRKLVWVGLGWHVYVCDEGLDVEISASLDAAGVLTAWNDYRRRLWRGVTDP